MSLRIRAGVYDRRIQLLVMVFLVANAGVAHACGGAFRLNFFRTSDDLKDFLARLSDEARIRRQQFKIDQEIFFSRTPDLDYSLESVSVSLNRNPDGHWKALVVRSKGPIAQQAKEDYLASRPIDFDYELQTMDESSCPMLPTIAASLIQQSKLASDPDWRRRNGDDGTTTCSSVEYSLTSNMDPKVDFVWGNGGFHAFSGWIHTALKVIEECQRVPKQFEETGKH